MIYARRMSEYAGELAEKENDPKRKAELLKISQVNAASRPTNPRHSGKPSRQCGPLSPFLVVEENQTGMSIGRVDQYMYPYYQADLEAAG